MAHDLPDFPIDNEKQGLSPSLRRTETDMRPLGLGARCRIDIPDETNANYGLHGQHGVVVNIIEGGSENETRYKFNGKLYRVKLKEEERTVDLRARDLRPPID